MMQRDSIYSENVVVTFDIIVKDILTDRKKLTNASLTRKLNEALQETEKVIETALLQICDTYF